MKEDINNNKKSFYELLQAFNSITINEIIRKFEIYNPTKETFNINYFYEKDFANEEWKQIGKLNYKVSNYGRIKNIQTSKLKQLKFNKYGMQVILWSHSKPYNITISRLVAHFFIKRVSENERVRHRNGNIRDNYFKNLEIVSK